MKYKVGNFVKIKIPKDKDTYPGFTKEMENAFSDPNKRYLIISREIYNNKKLYYINEHLYTLLEDWLISCNLHSTGGNV